MISEQIADRKDLQAAQISDRIAQEGLGGIKTVGIVTLGTAEQQSGLLTDMVQRAVIDREPHIIIMVLPQIKQCAHGGDAGGVADIGDRVERVVQAIYYIIYI